MILYIRNQKMNIPDNFFKPNNKHVESFYDALSPIPYPNPLQQADTDKITFIENGPDNESKERLQNLKTDLDNLSKMTNSADITRQLVKIIKELTNNLMKDFDIQIDPSQFEICISGSIAKGNPTNYSDIDYFVIFSDTLSEDDQKKLIAIFHILMNIQKTVNDHIQPKCIGVDVGGINPSNMIGNVDEIYGWLEDTDDPAYWISAESAVSISGDYSKLNVLTQKLEKEQVTPQYCFKRLCPIEQVDPSVIYFTGPHNPNVIDIKQNIFRPINFLLQGLRIQNGISAQDFHSQIKLIKELRQAEKISPVMAELIIYIFQRASQIRLRHHQNLKGEHDVFNSSDPEFKELIQLVQLVGWLRGSLEEYMNTDMSGKFTLLPETYLSSGNHLADLDEHTQPTHDHIIALQKNCLRLISEGKLVANENAPIDFSKSIEIGGNIKPASFSEQDIKKFIMFPFENLERALDEYKIKKRYLLFVPDQGKINIKDRLLAELKIHENNIKNGSYDTDQCIHEFNAMLESIANSGLENIETKKNPGQLATILKNARDDFDRTLTHLRHLTKEHPMYQQIKTYSNLSKIIPQNNIQQELNNILGKNNIPGGAIAIPEKKITPKFENNQVRLNATTLKDETLPNNNAVNVCSVQRVTSNVDGSLSYRSDFYFPNNITLSEKQLAEWAIREVENFRAILIGDDKKKPIKIIDMTDVNKVVYIKAYCEEKHYPCDYSGTTPVPPNNLLMRARHHIKTIKPETIIKPEPAPGSSPASHV